MFGLGIREIIVLGVLFGIPTLIILALVRHRGRSSHCAKLDDDELRTLTDLAEGLERMEGRIVNLETILMDQAHVAGVDRESTETPPPEKRYRKDA